MVKQNLPRWDLTDLYKNIKDGQIDRQQLADFVFAHPKERARLEALTHPLIASKLANALHDLEKEGHPLVVYEASLIFEKNLQDRFAAVILIAAPEDLQIERALSRGGMTRNQVQARIRSQMPTEQKRLLATYVIDNVASKAVLRQQVDLILAKLA